MVKANDLIKEQQDRDNKKFIIFDKILKNIEKKILRQSKVNLYYAWYEIPEFLLGSPSYSYNECVEYNVKKLKNNGFDVESFKPNILLIKWFPKEKKNNN